MGRAAEVVAPSSLSMNRWRCPVAKVNDLSRSLAALEQDSTLLAVVEMGAAKWLVCGTVPGVARQPLKKLDADAPALLRLIERWRGEAERCGRRIARVVVAYEAGRDGFWLARWLMARGIEVHVIHSAVRGGVAREKAGQDRPARCGHADARALGLAARRARALFDGGDPERGRGGRQAPEPRARDLGRRAGAHQQPRSRGRSSASASAGSIHLCARRRNAWRGCARRRVRSSTPYA